MDKDRPRVGVGVLIRKGDKVLLGKRLGSHGNGMWAPPGGHLEFGEKWEACAKREVAEETGVEIENIKFGFVTNDIFHETGKHYVTLFMTADFLGPEPKILETDKCEKWEWFGWEDLPEPLFLPMENAISQGYKPF